MSSAVEARWEPPASAGGSDASASRKESHFHQSGFSPGVCIAKRRCHFLVCKELARARVSVVPKTIENISALRAPHET
jgi:hypothetical protein